MEDRELAMRMGIAYDRDVILGTIMVVVLLEATRRVAGLALPIIAGLSIAYAFLGRYMPDAIAHAGFSLEDVAVTLYLTTEGIFSIPLTVSANYRSEEHTSELQSLMRISYAVFCLKKKNQHKYL